MTDPFDMDDDDPEAPWNTDPVAGLPDVITPGQIAIEFWKRGYNDEPRLFDFFFHWDGGREAEWFYDISSSNPGLSVMSSAPFSGTASWKRGSTVRITYFAGDFGLEGKETFPNSAPKDDALSQPQTWVDLAADIAGFCDELIQ